MLVLLYCLSQDPQFSETLKPLMGQLKNSEQMLRFLNDLSRFTQTFSTLNGQPYSPPKTENQEEKKEPPKEKKEDCQKEKEEPQSPTTGIADDFIQQILEGYLKKH